MTLEKRIDAFHQLGNKIKSLSLQEREALLAKTANENPWFNPENVNQALDGISKFLDRDVLEKWLSNYAIKNPSKKIGVAMAGNIPLVGFHDLLWPRSAPRATAGCGRPSGRRRSPR